MPVKGLDAPFALACLTPGKESAALSTSAGSTFSALSPGDVILTGTPGGIGKKRTPPLFMQPGDRVEVEIEQIGCLMNTVRSDAAVAR